METRLFICFFVVVTLIYYRFVVTISMDRCTIPFIFLFGRFFVVKRKKKTVCFPISFIWNILCGPPFTLLWYYNFLCDFILSGFKTIFPVDSRLSRSATILLKWIIVSVAVISICAFFVKFKSVEAVRINFSLSKQWCSSKLKMNDKRTKTATINRKTA